MLDAKVDDVKTQSFALLYFLNKLNVGGGKKRGEGGKENELLGGRSESDA